MRCIQAKPSFSPLTFMVHHNVVASKVWLIRTVDSKSAPLLDQLVAFGCWVIVVSSHFGVWLINNTKMRQIIGTTKQFPNFNICAKFTYESIGSFNGTHTRILYHEKTPADLARALGSLIALYFNSVRRYFLPSISTVFPSQLSRFLRRSMPKISNKISGS